MGDDSNHTPIPHLLTDDTSSLGTQSDSSIQDPQSEEQSSEEKSFESTSDQQNEEVVSTATSKESGPTILRQEVSSENSSENNEVQSEHQEKEANKSIQHKKDIPDIHPDAAQAGLQVAPSASPFPTIYDIKVPLLKDEEIEKDLHLNFFSGGRWLAEICRYILWQAHIRLKRIGGKVVRERIPDRF